MSYGRMREKQRQLREEVKELLAQATAADTAEDAEYGSDRRGDELPAELQRRDSRLKRIREAKRALEARVIGQIKQDSCCGDSLATVLEAAGFMPPEDLLPMCQKAANAMGAGDYTFADFRIHVADVKCRRIYTIGSESIAVQHSRLREARGHEAIGP